MAETGHGPVEAAYRAWIATLGGLSPRQEAEAEHLYALASQLDLKGERPASAYASLSRAIAKTADRLRDEKNGPQTGTQPAPGPNVVPADVVSAARTARANRRGGGTA